MVSADNRSAPFLGRGQHLLDIARCVSKASTSGAHIVWAAIILEQDEPTYPIDVGILGADAVIQTANTGTHLVKQFRFGCCARGVIDSCFRVLYNV